MTYLDEKISPAHQASIEGEGFEVKLARTGLAVTVAADQTILEALEQAGVDVPNSCRSGVCGACETPILEGVADHLDGLLTPAEQDAGKTMMICCSRARTARLVLDL